MRAKCPIASSCVPCCAGSASACITSLLNAWAENGTPAVALGCMPPGPANGDLGMLLLRTCDASYTRALGCAMCQAQRCVVMGPSVLAMPRSSPAGHGGAGLRLAAAINAAGSAAGALSDAALSSAATSAHPCQRAGERIEKLARNGNVVRFISQALRVWAASVALASAFGGAP